MKSFLKVISSILIATVLCACATTPRVSSWESPRGFTKEQVFNAAMQAGGQNGMKTAYSDRNSGTMSFSKTIGHGITGGDMILSVQITAANGIVKVQTTGNFSNVAIAGLHEEVIHNFHVFLFRNLNISAPSTKNVRIEEMK